MTQLSHFERACNLCGEAKPHSAYYAGVPSRCRECHRKAVRKNRAANLRYYREYDRRRHSEDPVRREATLRHGRQWAKDHPVRMAAFKKAWDQRNPEKKAASTAVGNALRAGRLERQSCEVCGSSKAQAHHGDYLKPLDVIWLCARCHADEHIAKRDALRG